MKKINKNFFILTVFFSQFVYGGGTIFPNPSDSSLFFNERKQYKYVIELFEIPRQIEFFVIRKLPENHSYNYRLDFSPGLTLPDQAFVDSLTDADLQLLSVNKKYLKKDNNTGKFVEMSAAEKQEVDQAELDLAAEKEAQRQASKPLGQRQYENQFFDLIEELHNATGVTNQVTPKLGFPEIQTLIETIQVTDPMGAVNYSLKLLTVDSALKRYDTLWWDDAVQHEIPEE